MSTAIYVAIVEGSQVEGYSAFFPDLPGCVTAAESMLELPAAARDALSLHLAGMIEDGETLPEPSPIEDIAGDPEVKEVGRLIVDAEIEDAPVRVNISIGAQILKRIDVAAEARGMSRSGFLVEAARAAIEERTDIHERWLTILTALSHDKPSHPGAWADYVFAQGLQDHLPSLCKSGSFLHHTNPDGRPKSGWSLFSDKPAQAASGVVHSDGSMPKWSKTRHG